MSHTLDDTARDATRAIAVLCIARRHSVIEGSAVALGAAWWLAAEALGDSADADAVCDVLCRGVRDMADRVRAEHDAAGHAADDALRALMGGAS